MTNYFVLDENRNVIPEPDPIKWAIWFEKSSTDRIDYKDGDFSRRVAKDSLDGVWHVSTVFLGLNHNWGDGPPILFESMIFWDEDDNNLLDNWERRYHTWDEALAGHKEIIQHLLANDMEWFNL